jgi:hypothetical protein
MVAANWNYVSIVKGSGSIGNVSTFNALTNADCYIKGFELNATSNGSVWVKVCNEDVVVTLYRRKLMYLYLHRWET